jgi:hypothetical protein
MKEDQQEKQRIIQELSQQLELHQQNFDILKRELNQVSRDITLLEILLYPI